MHTDPTTPTPAPREARETGFSDSERLTWLIANHGSFGSSSTWLGADGGMGRWDERVFVRRECAFGYEWHCYDGATPREAIDNAINAPCCTEHPVTGCANTRAWNYEVHDSPTETLRRRCASLAKMLAAALSARETGQQT